jgi:uncharacterized membrane protein YuzA (DUF378 family)
MCTQRIIFFTGVFMIDRSSLLLVIIGALNWGSIGLFQFDIVGYLFGGQSATVSRIIYTIVGLAGIWAISLLFKERQHEVEDMLYRLTPILSFQQLCSKKTASKEAVFYLSELIFSGLTDNPWVSSAMTSSSFVGMTSTLTFESSVAMSISLPRVLFLSSSMLMPINSSPAHISLRIFHIVFADPGGKHTASTPPMAAAYAPINFLTEYVKIEIASFDRWSPFSLADIKSRKSEEQPEIPKTPDFLLRRVITSSALIFSISPILATIAGSMSPGPCALGARQAGSAPSTYRAHARSQRLRFDEPFPNMNVIIFASGCRASRRLSRKHTCAMCREIHSGVSDFLKIFIGDRIKYTLFPAWTGGTPCRKRRPAENPPQDLRARPYAGQIRGIMCGRADALLDRVQKRLY